MPRSDGGARTNTKDDMAGCRWTAQTYPLFVAIPKDDVIPKFSSFGIFTGNFSDLELGDDLEMSRRIPRNLKMQKLPGDNVMKNEIVGIVSSFGITTNGGHRPLGGTNFSQPQQGDTGLSVPPGVSIPSAQPGDIILPTPLWVPILSSAPLGDTLSPPPSTRAIRGLRERW